MEVKTRDRALAVCWDAQRGAISYRVQWKSGQEDWDATRQMTTDGTSATGTPSASAEDPGRLAGMHELVSTEFARAMT